MKMNLKAKDFADKVSLEKTLSSRLKKPLLALINKSIEQLPFCYEVDYFGDGKGFLSIGECKDVIKQFKTKRIKGKGLDENGKAIKIDKKKVAMGFLSLNADGLFEFSVQEGIMKKMQAKGVIKSIPILKKQIGDKFVIVQGEAPQQEDKDVETNPQTNIINDDNEFSDEEKAAIKNLVNAIKKGLPLVKSQVVPHLKASTSTDEDKNIISNLIDNIRRFNDNYENAPSPVQQQLEKFHAIVNKQEQQLKAILQKLDEKAQKELNNILTPEQRRAIMDDTKVKLEKLMKDLKDLKAKL